MKENKKEEIFYRALREAKRGHYQGVFIGNGERLVLKNSAEAREALDDRLFDVGGDLIVSVEFH